jgi:hypothetical protein
MLFHTVTIRKKGQKIPCEIIFQFWKKEGNVFHFQIKKYFLTIQEEVNHYLNKNSLQMAA